MISPVNGFNTIHNYYNQAGFNTKTTPVEQGFGVTDTANRVSGNNSQGSEQGNAQATAISLKGKFVTGEQARIEKLLETYDEKTLKRMGIVECATCASRTYVDGSNDPGVSFKTPQHVSPAQSVQAVVSHEMEHVGREQSAAEQKGGQVLSQSVSIHMSTCPECGRSYSSGGVTRTTVSVPSKQVEPGQLVDMQL